MLFPLFFLASLSSGAVPANCNGEDRNEKCAKKDLNIGDKITVEESKYNQYIYCDCDMRAYNVEIESKATSIGEYTFYKSNLNMLEIPDSVVKIGSNAFQYCEINTLSFKDTKKSNLNEVGEFAFCCAKISSLELPEGLRTVGQYAFSSKDDKIRPTTSQQVSYKLTGVQLSSIGPYAFYEQSINLKNDKGVIEKLTFHRSITSIGAHAFEKCSGQLKIDINDNYPNLVSIEDYAFSETQLSGDIHINSNFQTLGEKSLYTTSTNSISIYLHSANSLVKIGNNAYNMPYFYLDQSLKGQLTFSDKLKVLGEKAFVVSKSYDPKKVVKKIVFNQNSNLDLIADNVFNVDGFDKMIFEGPITAHRIGNNAFEGCKLLNSPIRITARGNQGGYILDDAFKGCINLVNSLTIDAPTGQNLKLPTIGERAFDSIGITTLNLPHMEKIGPYAFSACEKLVGSSTLDLVSDEIGSYAFSSDIYVKFKSITSHHIYENAFSNCINLAPEKISLLPDEHVGGIVENDAFYNCRALKSTLEILAPGEPEKENDEKKYPTIRSNAFKNSGVTTLDFKCLIESIDSSAFENCFSLTNSANNAPLNIHTIGSNAFSGDKNLKLANVNINAEQISSKAFYQCYSLGANIVITDKSRTDTSSPFVLIGQSAFEDCTDLGKLTFNTSYIDSQNYAEERKIDESAFKNSGLQGPLTIPNTISDIGSYAFSYCSKIGQLTLDDDYLIQLTINKEAFYHSGASGALVIPRNVIKIDDSAFAHTLITGLTIQGSIFPAGDGSFTPINIIDKAFYFCTALTSVTFGDGEIKLDQNTVCKTFRGCDLRTVTLGSLTTIPKEAFYGMSKLNFPNPIPDTLTTIKEKAFAECTDLTNFKFNDNSQLSKIDQYAFYRCTSLSSFSFPFEVTSIEPYTFYQCSSLGLVTFNNEITTIKEYAFYECSALKGKLNFPKKLSSIKNSAFQNCYSLDQTLQLPDSVTSVGEKAFMSCTSFTGDLIFGRSITTVDEYAFRDCGFDGNLIFPEFIYGTSKLTLNKGAFYGCKGFKGNLILPKKATSSDGITTLTLTLGDYAFRDCSGFDGILSFPNTVTEIPEGAFYGCLNLGGDISTMKLTSIGKYAFYGCSQLSGSLNLEDLEGEDDGSSGGDSSGGSGDEESSGPSVLVNEYAFYGCRGLNGTLILPLEKTIEIKEHAFDGCSRLRGNLDGIKFTKIKKYAFAECSSLNGQLNFPEETTEIQEYAFKGCSGFSDQLSFIVKSIKDNGLTIGHCAFKDCSGFKNGRLTFDVNTNEETNQQFDRFAPYYRYDYFLKIGNDAFDGTKFKNVYYMGRFQPDCDYDIGISSIKGIHTSSNYANKTFCGNPIHKSKLSGGAIAGIVIACIVVVAVIVFLIIFFILKNKKNKDQSEAEVEMNQDP